MLRTSCFTKKKKKIISQHQNTNCFLTFSIIVRNAHKDMRFTCSTRLKTTIFYETENNNQVYEIKNLL